MPLGFTVESLGMGRGASLGKEEVGVEGRESPVGEESRGGSEKGRAGS